MGFLANPANRTVETSSKTHGLLRAPSPRFSISAKQNFNTKLGGGFNFFIFTPTMVRFPI